MKPPTRLSPLHGRRLVGNRRPPNPKTSVRHWVSNSRGKGGSGGLVKNFTKSLPRRIACAFNRASLRPAWTAESLQIPQLRPSKADFFAGVASSFDNEFR